MSITAKDAVRQGFAKRNSRIGMWAATLLILAVLGFLYIGSTHRDRCLKAGNSDGWGTVIP